MAARLLGAEPGDPRAGPGALGQEWHTARPILRADGRLQRGTTSAAERHVRDIPIHGGVNNWYIDVVEPPRSYRIDVGYLSSRGKFYVLARSNVVTTPKAGVADPLDENWLAVQKQIDRIENPASIGGGTNGHKRRSTCGTSSRSGCAGP